MKTFTVDGREHIVFIAKGWGDKGVSVNYYARNDDGTYTWYCGAWRAESVKDAATAEYDGVDEKALRDVLVKAEERDSANRVRLEAKRR